MMPVQRLMSLTQMNTGAPHKMEFMMIGWVQSYLSGSDDSSMQWENAKFLLLVTEEHKLTHNGVDNLCNSIQWLVDRVYHHCSTKLSRMLPDQLISTERKYN